jgi:hypothetical protein
MDDFDMGTEEQEAGRIIWCPPEDENVRLALLAARARGKFGYLEYRREVCMLTPAATKFTTFPPLPHNQQHQQKLL